MVRFTLIAVLTGLFLSGTSAAQAPSHIFFGSVITMDEAAPTAEALAVADGRIVAVGGRAEIETLRSDSTIVVELNGRVVMPSFVDPHTHVLNDRGRLGLDLEQAQDFAFQNGVTTIGNTFASAGFLNEMRALNDRGALRLRTSLYLSFIDPCGEFVDPENPEWYLDVPLSRRPDERLWINGVKIFTDGGVCGSLAIGFEAPGAPGERGDLWFSQDDLNGIVKKVHDQGYQLAIHAQGDRAVEQSLNALEATLDGNPNVLRHRIEHNAFVRPEQVPRYGAIGALPTLFTYFPTCRESNGSEFLNFYGPEPVVWLEDARAMLSGNPGLPVAWHSDTPYFPSHPFRHIFSQVTQQDRDDDGTFCLPPPWLDAHRITVEEALQMMTINAAFLLFREDQVGSLEVGKHADLIVLSDNPLEIPEQGLIDVGIHATMLEGEFVFCSENDPELCAVATGTEGVLADDLPGAGGPTILTYPNPFAERLQIGLELAEDRSVRIEIIDLLGRTVAVPSSGNHQPAGHARFIWAPELYTAPGHYIVRVTTDHFAEERLVTYRR